MKMKKENLNIPTEIVLQFRGTTLYGLLEEANQKLQHFCKGTPFAGCIFMCIEIKQITEEQACKTELWQLTFQVIDVKKPKPKKKKKTDKFLLSYLGRPN